MAKGIDHTILSPWPLRTRRHDGVACPACGQLECLCRPRFFAGQLLTEEDLNRLDHYMIEKNKLHNRYLHDWGVVCGLEVVCTCERRVTIRQGYAIDPCGNDIIVCEDHIEDLCELIEQCRTRERRQQDCGAYQPARDDGCRETEEDWLLAICYDEKPSRGIAALRNTGASSCHSSRGQVSFSSCTSSRDKRDGNEPNLNSRSHCRQALPQCEPTIICEGYKFKVFKAPSQSGTNQASMTNRFQACYEALRSVIPPQPEKLKPEDWHRWCCTVKSRLQDYLRTHPTYDCRLPQKLACLPCPQPESQPNGIKKNSHEYRDKIINILTPILTEFVRYCYCSALLPPCPNPAENACVVLATITVPRNGCHINRVCNWEGRKLAVTLPNIQYWLSWISFDQDLRNHIINECCEFSAPESMSTLVSEILGGKKPSNENWLSSRLKPLWDNFLSRVKAPYP